MPDLASLTTLHCQLEGPIATLTLNRPEVLHALNNVMFDELEFAFTILAADPTIRAVILTGNGDRAFAAGADIRALAETDAATGLAASQRGQQVFALIESHLEQAGKPVIAAINGEHQLAPTGYQDKGPTETYVRVHSEFKNARACEALAIPLRQGVLPDYSGKLRVGDVARCEDLGHVVN